MCCLFMKIATNKMNSLELLTLKQTIQLISSSNFFQCNSKSSCWDRSQSKCFCVSETEPCPHDPIPDPSAAPTCDPDQKHSWMADNGDCKKYYECYKGYMWNRDCPLGWFFVVFNKNIYFYQKIDEDQKYFTSFGCGVYLKLNFL